MLIKLALLLHDSSMPLYRIVIWTKQRRKPFSGIRFIENHNISMVQGQMEKRAIELYHSNYIDCEVQMLAKTCSAVKKHIALKHL